jgi:hypothetical protein
MISRRVYPLLWAAFTLMLVGYGPLDDRGADEHGMDRSIAEDIDRDLRFEGVELSTERVALDRHVEQGQDRRLAAGDVAAEDDHPGARPEDRCAALGQIEDRLTEPPALDELAHRRALATGQDQATDVVEVGRFTDTDALDPDRRERIEMLAERTLQGEDADPHARTPGPGLTSRGRRVAPAPGSPRGRSPASVLPGPC